MPSEVVTSEPCLQWQDEQGVSHRLTLTDRIFLGRVCRRLKLGRFGPPRIRVIQDVHEVEAHAQAVGHRITQRQDPQLARLLPDLELDEKTHDIEITVLTSFKGESKVQISAIEKAVLAPIRVAAKKAEMWQWAKMTEANAECLERLKEAGMQINEIPESELDRFRKLTYEKVFPTVIKNKDLGPNTKELIDMTIWAQQ